MTNIFLSVDNFKELINIITQYFKDKHKVDIHNITSLDTKKVFYNILKKIESDPQNSKKSLIEKNKLALTIVKQIIQKDYKINDSRESIHQNDGNMISSYPKYTRTEQTANDINKEFKSIQNERYEASVNNNNTLDTTVITDISLSPDNFKSQIDTLQNTRNTFDASLTDLFPKDSTRTFEVSDIITKDIASIDTKSIYQTSFNNDNNNDNLSLNNQKHIDTVISNDNVSRYKLKKNIIIDSSDRNWISYNSRFNYIINFFTSPKERISIPYYKNNPTIPFTKSDVFNGITNTEGFKIGDITFDAFDQDLNQNGNTDVEEPIIMGYETMNIAIDNISMLNSFKQIYSICVNTLTLPLGIGYQSATGSGTEAFEHFNMFNVPYILLCIEELQGTHDGTNNIISKAFCQLQYKEFVKIDQAGSPTQRGSLILRPSQQSEKIFFPTPLTQLNTLTISLYKPSGELLSSELDNHTISTIDQVMITDVSALRVELQNGFSVNEFYTNDYIQIKNMYIYQPINIDDVNLTSIKVSNFNDFINRSIGHKIIDVSVSENKVSIAVPTSILYETIGAFLGTGATFTPSYVINLSLQHSLSFSVESYNNYHSNHLNN